MSDPKIFDAANALTEPCRDLDARLHPAGTMQQLGYFEPVKFGDACEAWTKLHPDHPPALRGLIASKCKKVDPLPNIWEPGYNASRRYACMFDGKLHAQPP